VIAVAADFEVPWVAGAGIVGIAAGAAAGTRVADKILTDVVDPVRAAVAARAAVDERLALVIHGGAGLSPLRDVDPYSIGVWRSAAAEEQRDKAVTRPPYVPRSIDGALADRLATIGPEGGVVVVSGHPKAGKSRTLFEALARSPVTQDRTLYALRTPNTTAGAATTRPFDALIDTRTDIDGPTSVLWMDDAHEHFSYGLTLARLTKLRERHERLIVAMTIHTERLQPPPRRAEADELSPVDLALLDHLAQLAHDLATTLSAQEQGVARDAYPGLLDHIESPVDFERLPSWFAGVDYLRDRYHRAGPVHYGGKAVARAAINWRRAGKPAGINDTQLRQLADIALDELDPGAAYTDDTYAAALDWARGVDKASDPGWHGIALVRPVPGSNQSLWRDFDAVTAWVTDGPRPDPPLSHRTWTAVLDHVTPDTAFPVGIAAYRRAAPGDAGRQGPLSADRDTPAPGARDRLLADAQRPERRLDRRHSRCGRPGGVSWGRQRLRGDRAGARLRGAHRPPRSPVLDIPSHRNGDLRRPRRGLARRHDLLDMAPHRLINARSGRPRRCRGAPPGHPVASSWRRETRVSMSKRSKAST
jgi:hypothetical protein